MTRWRRHLLALSITLALILLIFARDVATMTSIWWTSSTFNHCLMILPIVGWLIWQRFDELKRLTPAVWLPGLAFVALAALLWILGAAAGLNLARHTALIFLIQATVITILGKQVARGLMFPLFYLIFMIPIGEELVPILQTLTAKICIFLLELSHIPAKIDGVFITVPNGFYQVAEACSGVKFLVAMLAYGALVAHVLFRSWLRRFVFMVGAIIVPVLANGVRAFGTIYIGYLTNSNFAKSFDHVIYGWFFFGFVMVLMLLLSWRFIDRKIGEPWLSDMPLVQSSRVTPVQAALVTMMIALLPLGWEIGVARAGHVPMPHQIGLPQVPGWQRVPMMEREPWVPRFDGADHRLLGRYQNATGATVDLAIVLYAWQDEKRKIIGYAHGAIDPDGPWRWTNDEPPPPNGKAERILGPDKRARLVESFYDVGGTVSANPATIKLSTMAARLFGGDQAAVAVLLATDDAPRGGARVGIDEFATALGPFDRLSVAYIAQARGH